MYKNVLINFEQCYFNLILTKFFFYYIFVVLNINLKNYIYLETN